MQYLRTSLSATLIFACCIQSSASPAQHTHPSQRPNILLITIDTLRPDHLGCYGDQQIRTPAVDSLCADGVRFDQAFTSVPITLPSHSALMTGTFPIFNGIHDFSGNRLSDTQPTLASELRAVGYNTGAVVGAAVLDSRFGLNRGFGYYYDDFDFSRAQAENLERMERPANIVVDRALEWLRKNSGQRFFLWMHLYDPHAPYSPPAPFNSKYKDHPYDGEIAFADSQLARVFEYLKGSGLYSRTLIVLCGDHGEGLGEHGERTHGFFIYNSTLHVPLIIKLAPSLDSRGRLSDFPVNLIDVMPTVLQIVGVRIPATVEGQSFWQVLHGGSKPEERTPLYAETYLPRLHFNWSELRGIQAEGYHFIDAPEPELYDLSTDSGELRNLFSNKKAIAEELQHRLGKTIERYNPDREQAQATSLDPAMADRLKSLGYAAVTGGGNPTLSNRNLPDPKDRLHDYDLISDAIDDSQHQHYDKSIEKLNEALRIEETNITVHYLLAEDYLKMLDFERAIAEYQRVLDLSPNYAVAAYQAGLAYVHLDQFASAAEYLKRALMLDPQNYHAAHDLGAAYVRLKMFDESITAFRQCTTINSEYASCHQSLGEILHFMGRTDEALPELRKAVELAPQNQQAHFALAKALEAKGFTSQAQTEFRKAGAAAQNR